MGNCFLKKLNPLLIELSKIEPTYAEATAGRR